MIEIRWHGRGGQGAFTVARMLGAAAVAEGKFAQAFPSFGPERRGAPVTAFTRIAGTQILNRSEAMQPHFVVVLDETLFGPAITDRLRPDGVILINTSNPEKYPPGSNYRIVTLDATAMAMQALGRPIGNVAMFAALAAVSGTVGQETAVDVVRESLPEAVRELNAELFRSAYLQLKGGV